MKNKHSQTNTADESEANTLVEETNTQETTLQDENNDFKAKYLRLLAEFSNYQRQKEEELKSMAKFGNKNLLLKILDILDDIEIGLVQENITDETKVILEILQSKMMHLLSLEGVTQIELKAGDEYDSNTCEVITTIDDESNKNKISQVIRKGYNFSERVLRTAKVVVGK